jgi:hypothetical protein
MQYGLKLFSMFKGFFFYYKFFLLALFNCLDELEQILNHKCTLRTWFKQEPEMFQTRYPY